VLACAQPASQVVGLPTSCQHLEQQRWKSSPPPPPLNYGSSRNRAPIVRLAKLPVDYLAMLNRSRQDPGSPKRPSYVEFLVSAQRCREAVPERHFPRRLKSRTSCGRPRCSRVAPQHVVQLAGSAIRAERRAAPQVGSSHCPLASLDPGSVETSSERHPVELRLIL
jgi:hypothetical protein